MKDKHVMIKSITKDDLREIWDKVNQIEKKGILLIFTKIHTQNNRITLSLSYRFDAKKR